MQINAPYQHFIAFQIVRLFVVFAVPASHFILTVCSSPNLLVLFKETVIQKARISLLLGEETFVPECSSTHTTKCLLCRVTFRHISKQRTTWDFVERGGFFGLVLALSWSCVGLVLVLCWSCAGLVLVLCWSSVGLVLVFCRSRVDLVLVLCWSCAGLVLVLCWSCAGLALVLCWYCVGLVLVLCWLRWSCVALCTFVSLDLTRCSLETEFSY